VENIGESTMRNRIYILIILLLLVSLISSITVAIRQKIEIDRCEMKFRTMRDSLLFINAHRRTAMDGSIHDAMRVLSQLCEETHQSEKTYDIVRNILEVERKEAIRNILSNLKAKTGQNFGDDPKAWIKVYNVEK
jgi:hypothetical protein